MEQTLTHSEWYVMDCLWQHSPSTVMEPGHRPAPKGRLGQEHHHHHPGGAWRTRVW